MPTTATLAPMPFYARRSTSPKGNSPRFSDDSPRSGAETIHYPVIYRVSLSLCDADRVLAHGARARRRRQCDERSRNRQRSTRLRCASCFSDNSRETEYETCCPRYCVHVDCAGARGQTAPHVHLGIVSDWTQHHVLYPDSKDDSAMARIRRDPRWVQNGISAIARFCGRNALPCPARAAAETGACLWGCPGLAAVRLYIRHW